MLQKLVQQKLSIKKDSMAILNSLIFFILSLFIKYIDARDDTAIRDTFTNNIRNSIMSQLDKAFSNFTIPQTNISKSKNGNNVQFKGRESRNNNIIIQPPISRIQKPIQIKTIKPKSPQIQSVNITQLTPLPSITSFQPLPFVPSINTNIQLSQFKPRYQTIQQIPPHIILSQQQPNVIKSFEINNFGLQQKNDGKTFQQTNPLRKTNLLTNRKIETPNHFPFHCQSQQIQTYSSSNPRLTINSQKPSQTNTTVLNPLSIVTPSITPISNQFNIQKQLVTPLETKKTITKPILQQSTNEQQKVILQLMKALQRINTTINPIQNNRIPQNQIVTPILSNTNFEVIKPTFQSVLPQINSTNIKILPSPNSVNLFVPPQKNNIVLNNNLNTNSNIINGTVVNQIGVASNLKETSQPTNNSHLFPPPGTIQFLSLVSNQSSLNPTTTQSKVDQQIFVQDNKNKNNIQNISFLLSQLSNPNSLQPQTISINTQPPSLQNQLKRQISSTQNKQNFQKPFILPNDILSILNITSQLPAKEIILKSEQYFKNASKVFQQCQDVNRNLSSLQVRLALNKCQLQYQNSKAIHEIIGQKYQKYLQQLNQSPNSTISSPLNNLTPNGIGFNNNNNNLMPFLVSSVLNSSSTNQSTSKPLQSSSTNSLTPQVGGFLTSLGFRNSS